MNIEEATILQGRGGNFPFTQSQCLVARIHDDAAGGIDDVDAAELRCEGRTVEQDRPLNGGRIACDIEFFEAEDDGIKRQFERMNDAVQAAFGGRAQIAQMQLGAVDGVGAFLDEDQTDQPDEARKQQKHRSDEQCCFAKP